MAQAGTLKDFNLQLSVATATVIHANKYSRAEGVFSPFVISSLHTEIVFRKTGTNEDLSCYVRNLDLPIYSGEEVMVVEVGNIIVGYIDSKTKFYYYITKNLGRRLGLGIAFFWIWLAAIAASFMIVIFNRFAFTPWCLPPILLAWLLIKGRRVLLNSRLKKRIDQILSEG